MIERFAPSLWGGLLVKTPESLAVAIWAQDVVCRPLPLLDVLDPLFWVPAPLLRWGSPGAFCTHVAPRGGRARGRLLTPLRVRLGEIILMRRGCESGL